MSGPLGLLSEADETRILAIAAPTLLPLFRRRREQVLAKLRGEYRSGMRDFTNSVAEFATYEDLIAELERKLAQSER
jgi:hypothetical protein